MRFLYILLLGLGSAQSGPLTYDTNPLGSLEEPVILRTYVPDPGLDPAVLANHGKASQSPKYNAGNGRDVSGEYKMMKVIPAAIAVNHGPALSYVFDTIECRLLYAWQGGFLDLYPYWGDEKKGGRRAFNYGSRLVGNLFHLAQPAERAKAKFLGYKLSDKGVPTFRYQLGDVLHQETISPNETEYSFTVSTLVNGIASTRVITGNLISRHQGFERDLKIKTAGIEAGETVFGAYGCIACHSTDGSRGHGPTLQGLFRTTRALEGGGRVVADEGYLRESILTPNAKTAEGFPPNYMPPYQLKPREVDSLVLFIQSLANSSPE